MKTYLLKRIDGASIALKKVDESSAPEMLMPRQDLYVFDGGYSWGYYGSGAFKLAYAILSDCLDNDALVHNSAKNFVEEVISILDGQKEHLITEKQIIKNYELVNM